MAMPPFLQNFVDGPKLPKVVLGVLGLVLIVGGGYYFLVAPVTERITVLEARRTQLQAELGVSRAQVAELQRFRMEIAELQRRLDLLVVKLPTEKETPGLYKTLSEAAQGAGLGVSLFQPREPRPRDVVNEIPIVIVAEGGYHQLGQFLEKVANLPRVVTVNDLKVSGLTRSRNSIRADLILATFMYRDTAPGPAKPGAVPAPAPPKPAAAAPAGKEANS